MIAWAQCEGRDLGGDGLGAWQGRGTAKKANAKRNMISVICDRKGWMLEELEESPV
jgi:hypothetical protein